MSTEPSIRKACITQQGIINAHSAIRLAREEAPIDLKGKCTITTLVVAAVGTIGLMFATGSAVIALSFFAFGITASAYVFHTISNYNPNPVPPESQVILKAAADVSGSFNGHLLAKNHMEKLKFRGNMAYFPKPEDDSEENLLPFKQCEIIKFTANGMQYIRDPETGRWSKGNGMLNDSVRHGITEGDLKECLSLANSIVLTPITDEIVLTRC